MKKVEQRDLTVSFNVKPIYVLTIAITFMELRSLTYQMHRQSTRAERMPPPGPHPPGATVKMEKQEETVETISQSHTQSSPLQQPLGKDGRRARVNYILEQSKIESIKPHASIEKAVAFEVISE